MHFIKTFVSALLVTSVLGQFTHVVRSNDQLGLSSRGPKASPKGRANALKYCSKAYRKGGKRDVEERGLETRVNPGGYTNVLMGQSHGATAAEPGLYSDQFGTCPGFVVTGRPNGANGKAKFLFHLSLGQSYAQAETAFNTFAQTVTAAKMTNMKGWMYTVDTRNSNPELRDPDAQDMAAGVEEDYTKLRAKLQTLVGSRNTVSREYHDFGKPGEIHVAKDGAVSFHS